MPSRRTINVGPVSVGGGALVAVQSMTCTRTGDARATLAQIDALAAAGCEIARVALPHANDVPAFVTIVAESPLPVVADIHYDWRLAMAAITAGAAGIRINPGTMAEKHVREIVHAAATTAEKPVAIRIGVNAGSLPRDLRTGEEAAPAEILVEAAMRWAEQFETWGFAAYKLSVKSSSVPTTIAAYRLLAARTDAPLHVGVTEAGTLWSGTIKSAVGIGALLADGIGDTIRVSLTGDPVQEVRVAWRILAALNLRHRGPEVISCPTCGRTEIDIVSLAEEVERRLSDEPALAARVITVAVMGCRVNGPEEARHADYGIAAGAGGGILFDHGERVAALPANQLIDALLDLIAGRRDRPDDAPSQERDGAPCGRPVGDADGEEPASGAGAGRGRRR